MANELDLPADLQHLLEKRGDGDRRKKQRRKSDGAASGSINVPPRGKDRRARTDRRKKTRRDGDG